METLPTGLEQTRHADRSRLALLGRVVGWGAVALAVLAAIQVFRWNRRHPRSDNAVVSAPVIGIAPRVSGPIRSLAVRDNQRVQQGAVLFEIDDQPYRLMMEVAAGNLAAVEGELANARQLIAAQEQQVRVGSAMLTKAENAQAEATETYNRMAPLLEKRFASPEQVDTARRARDSSVAGVEAARAGVLAAQAAIPNLAPIEARRQAAKAGLAQAELALQDCTVRAPFDALVAGMNLAEGSFARIGVDVFALIDTRNWSVVAAFNEGQLERIPVGSRAKVELMTAPGREFVGVVESAGWGVTALPQDPFPGLPIVMRELDWVRLAQKFPVRIRLSNDVPAEFLRAGATASATILPGE